MHLHSAEKQIVAGEHVLADAVEIAASIWKDRLVAAYALGSLAHGGFSPHVSDVDVGFVLADPLDDTDSETVMRITSGIRASGMPLGDKLSIFWGSPATLSGTAGGGRFPPLDIFDLKQFGRLLAGRDITPLVRSPTLRELIVSTAGFALRVLSTSEVMSLLRDPMRLANAETKKLTKLVLYPARFLFTARTGQVGMNDRAVAHFTAVESGPVSDLVGKGLEWRFTPPHPGDRAVAELLGDGVLPLYRMFLAEYEQRLREYGETELAQAYREWRERLD